MSGQWLPSPPSSQVDSYLRDTHCVCVLLVTSSGDPMGTLTSRHSFPVDERFPAQGAASIVTVKRATPIYPGAPPLLPEAVIFKNDNSQHNSSYPE